MGVVLFDTNIRIDALHSHQEAFDELSNWKTPAISVVTFAEVYAGANHRGELRATAQGHRLLVITRNKKDFKGQNVRIPYELETITTTRVINVRPLPT